MKLVFRDIQLIVVNWVKILGREEHLRTSTPRFLCFNGLHDNFISTYQLTSGSPALQELFHPTLQMRELSRQRTTRYTEPASAEPGLKSAFSAAGRDTDIPRAFILHFLVPSHQFCSACSICLCILLSSILHPPCSPGEQCLSNQSMLICQQFPRALLLKSLVLIYYSKCVA